MRQGVSSHIVLGFVSSATLSVFSALDIFRLSRSREIVPTITGGPH